MKAIALEQAGDADNLHVVNLPEPIAGNGEVVIQTKAISINPVDIKTRKGKSLYKELIAHNPKIILGWDVSGIVKEVGKDVTEFNPGDEVFGMVNFPGHGQAYAEYVAAPATELAFKPTNISHEEAAAATLAALTAWQALTKHAKIKKGQRVLIHAASGGVGHYAVQFAKYLGAYVIGTSSTVNKDFVLSLGADEHIDYKTQRIEDTAKDIDFTLDAIGGDNLDTSIAVTKEGGSVIALPSGSLDNERVEKAKKKGVKCFFFIVESNTEDIRQIADLLKKEIVHSHVSQIFPFDQMKEAHLQVESGKTKGKIVVTI